MSFLELEDYETEARKLRKLLSLDGQSQPDMMTVIVKLKHLGLIANYERVPDREMIEDEAQWDPETRLLKLRESIFCGANQLIPNARSRWTIAHELGHMWLKHRRARNRNVSGRSIEKIAAPIRRDEHQAHGFAAAFLAPAHLIENPLETSVDQLMTQFNISRAAAERRKPDLERLYRRANNIPRPLPPSIAEFLKSRKQ